MVGIISVASPSSLRFDNTRAVHVTLHERISVVTAPIALNGLH
jgi:hypothetical protein